MKVAAAFLTTYDRPALLGQSLPSICSQATQLGLPLLIVDDGSDDPRTLEMLASVERAGAEVLRIPRDGLHAHLSIGRAFLTGLKHLLARHGRDIAIIKVDDDTWLAPDALRALVDGWDALEAAGVKASALSAMIDGPEKKAHAEVVPGIWRTNMACSVTCVHRLDLWERCIREAGELLIAWHGWDSYFWMQWLNQRQDGRAFTLCPSRVFHVGHLGVHGRDLSHLNRLPPDAFAFPGEWVVDDFGLPLRPAGIKAESPPGEDADWLRLYGSRTTVHDELKRAAARALAGIRES